MVHELWYTKKRKKWRFFSSTHVDPRKRIATEVGGVEQNCCRFPVPTALLALPRRGRSTPPPYERADSRNRARENERRRARVVAVWPGTGGHPAVYLPFEATCWIQRAKHGRGGGEGERSTSARGVATPTPTRAVCKRSSVEDEAEGRF